MTGNSAHGTTPGGGTISPTEPAGATIQGVRVIARTIHLDPRGILLETFRSDDDDLGDAPFAMSYTSVTLPGEFRDRDRWHVHERQTDRFVVILGEMHLALADARPGSPTSGLVNVLRMVGAPYDRPSGPTGSRLPSYLVTIPPGVLHCIGNLSHRPFVLANFPTRLYDPADEGRRPFADVDLASLSGRFEWGRVARAESSNAVV